MDPASLAGLEAFIGGPRFNRYLSRYGGNRIYAARLYGWNHAAAAAHLVKAFPHAQHGRRYVHAKLRDIQHLRNRIAHHEPIYVSPLQQVYDAVLEVAAMVHPDTRTFIDGCSTVPTVLAAQQAAITQGDVTF